MLRPVDTRVAPSVLTAVLAVAGCSGAEEPAASASDAVTPADSVRSRFTVSFDPGSYDAEAVYPALRDCGGLPGANDVGTGYSNPPVHSLRFAGSPTQQTAVRSCLEALPGSTVRESADAE